MRIQVYSSGLGPKVFMKRLLKYMVKHYDDVEIVNSKPDIYLSAVWAGESTRCKRIHRVDGVYFDKLRGNLKALNKRIIGSIKKANGVVFQSSYARKMTKGILKVKAKDHVIIPNGIDKSVFDGIETDKLGYDKMFIACAKWRPLKRPRSIARGFLEAAVPGSVLVIIGDISSKDKVKSKNIKYTGSLKTNEMYRYYKSADAVIHISRLDACPNVVVESLVAGTPVICNNVGGTPELVRDDGIHLEIDPPLKYKPFSMKHPDSVSPKIIAAGIHQCLSVTWDIDRPDLDMSYCADKYYKYFQKVLIC